MSEYQEFLEDPVSALEKKFEKHRRSIYFGHKDRDRIFCHVGFVGLDGVRYGSYKNVMRDYLLGRRFEITCLDYSIGLDFLDVLHHPRRYCQVSIPYDMGDTSDEVLDWVRSNTGKRVLEDRGFGEFTKQGWR